MALLENNFVRAGKPTVLFTYFRHRTADKLGMEHQTGFTPLLSELSITP